MAGIVKKGYLEVKKKGMLGNTYKKKYILLRRDIDEGGKMIEIRESEHIDDDNVEFHELKDMWSVQEKSSQNKKRYPFELTIGANILITCSCSSISERKEWIESFHILNKVTPYSSPLNAPDMYLVSLETNQWTSEIGIAGPCLLRIQDRSIVLYSECGRKRLYHWTAENVESFMSVSGDQLRLEAYRTGTDTLMEFRFNTESDTARQILASWTVTFMGTNVDNSQQQQQQQQQHSNYIPQYRSYGRNGGNSIALEDKSSKSATFTKGLFKQGKNNGGANKDDKGVIRRAKSFTDRMSYDTRLSDGGRTTPGGLTESHLSVASQDSAAYTINSVNPSTDEGRDNSPPPIPPRAPRRPRSVGMEAIDGPNRIDPDYSYIKDDVDEKEDLDKQLDDLMRDIEADNHRKTRRQTMGEATVTRRLLPHSDMPAKSKTLVNSMRYSDEMERKKKEFIDIYGVKEQASDYLEPIPSKKAIEYKRSSNPPLLSNGINERDDLFHQRHSTDFSSLRLNEKGASNHDYSIIPDRPLHVHSTSIDSTHSAPDLPPRTRRSYNAIDDPPSPQLVQLPSPTKLTKHYQSKTSEISPYATATNVSGIGAVRESSPPPLPPRSPNKTLRGTIPSHTERCTKCNGVKANKRLNKTQSLADAHHMGGAHHHHYHDPSRNSISETSTVTSPFFSIGSSNIKDVRAGSSTSLGKAYSDVFTPEETSISSPGSDKEELESALQLLDDCVKGLELIETDLPISPNMIKKNKSFNGEISMALQQTQQVQNDLFNLTKGNQVQRSFSVTTQSPMKPQPVIQTTPKRSMTIHKSSPSINPTQSLPTQAIMGTSFAAPAGTTRTYYHSPSYKYTSPQDTPHFIQQIL